MGCFTGDQVRLWKDDFGRDNFTRWIASGDILRLRRNLYTFPDYLQHPDSALYFSGKIYAPSYLSLHTALHFHGLIPEEVMQLTAVSTKKTAYFENVFGQYTYRHISPQYMYGFELLKSESNPNFTMLMATPEKALLDLLHLYPQYKTEIDMIELRLDQTQMTERFSTQTFRKHLERIGSPELSRRADRLIEVYCDSLDE